MKLFTNNVFKYTLLVLFCFSGQYSFSQTYDIISNWDGITQDWILYGQSAEVVSNPAPDATNFSAHCYKVVTVESQWDNISYTMPAPANFDHCYKYRLKVLAPMSGGDVTFKFQNENNSFWQEITKTPVPGQWTELEFDFSGLEYNNLTTMVIFYDFHGTVPGITWYLDDIVAVIPDPQPVESNLPIVVINTFDVFIPDNPKIDASMGIIDNGPGMVNHLTDPFNGYYGRIGIETRGHSTQMFPKKSFSVETRNSVGQDLDVSLLGMPAESDWILYAPYTDKSMMRNNVSYELGRSMDDIYCTRTAYCELVINGDYKGVYVLMEKIKKGEERLDIATLKPDEVSGEDVTGGYILAVDWLPDDFVYNADGWKSEVKPPYNNTIKPTFQYFYPERDKIVDPQRYYIRSYFTSAENALVSSSFTNPETGYHKYFDVPSFVDLMIMSELSKDVDKYRLSQYFYKEKDNVGGKIFAGPIWDFNLGYGNVDYWSIGIQTSGYVFNDIQTWDFSIMYWWKRLMEDPYYKDLTKTRWTYLRERSFSPEAINALIDSLAGTLSDAQARNYERWPILGTYVWPNYNWYNNDYSDEVAYFRNFINTRASWLDYNLPGKVLNPSVNIAAQGNTITLTVVGDRFRNRALKPEYFIVNNAPPEIYLQSVEYINTTECLLTLSGSVTSYGNLSVTVLEKAINTWNDVTSHILAAAGVNDNLSLSNKITLYNSQHELSVRCTKPELLPQTAIIVSISGSTVGEYTLMKDYENIIRHDLKPGMYLLVFQSAGGKEAFKFTVVR